MDFGYPLALWGAAVIPLVIALSLLARRRRDLFVPSLFIWKRIRIDQLQTPAKRRFLFSYSIFLQIVFAAAAVLALADARIITSQQPPVKRIFILDRSASMQTVNSDGTTRLAQAEKRLQELREQSGSSQPVLLDSSNYPENSGLIESLVANAIALVPKDQYGTIELLSDKLPVPPKEIPQNIYFIARVFGEPSRNIGIVAFDVEKNTDGSSNIFVRVKNYSAAEVAVPVKLFINGKEAETQMRNLKSAEECALVFSSSEKEISETRCELSLKDDLAFDNSAGGSWSKVPAEIFTDIENKDWLRAFRAALGERLKVVAEKQSAQLRIVRGVPPKNLPAGKIIYINPGTEAVASVAQKIKCLRPDSPIFTALGGYWNELALSRATKISLPSKFETLATLGENPVVARCSSPDCGAIYFGFDPMKEGFEPSSPAFPLLAVGLLKELDLFPEFQSNFQAKPFASDNRVPEVREKSYGNPPDMTKLSQRPVNLRTWLLLLSLACLLALYFIGDKQK